MVENGKVWHDGALGALFLLLGEYRGKRVETNAEWIQSNAATPNAEYELLAKRFNPVFSMQTNGSS